MSRESYYATFATILSLTIVTNLILVVSLIHTWKNWRQIKWYIILLSVGIWLEIFFYLAPAVASMKTSQTAYTESEAACKFLLAMSVFAMMLTTMSMAAASVHVLMTAVTGSQGSMLRHALTLGLSVMFCLPHFVSQLVHSRLLTIHGGDVICASRTEWSVSLGLTIYDFCFPALVSLCCLLPAVLLILMKRKGDVSLSDAVLSGVLGVIFIVTCLPFTVISINALLGTHSSIDTFQALQILWLLRSILSAIVVAVFAYVNMFRSRTPATDSTAMGERQKLVN